jgi:hypothetical protein
MRGVVDAVPKAMGVVIVEQSKDEYPHAHLLLWTIKSNGGHTFVQPLTQKQCDRVVRYINDLCQVAADDLHEILAANAVACPKPGKYSSRRGSDAYSFVSQYFGNKLLTAEGMDRKWLTDVVNRKVQFRADFPRAVTIGGLVKRLHSNPNLFTESPDMPGPSASLDRLVLEWFAQQCTHKHRLDPNADHNVGKTWTERESLLWGVTVSSARRVTRELQDTVLTAAHQTAFSTETVSTIGKDKRMKKLVTIGRQLTEELLLWTDTGTVPKSFVGKNDKVLNLRTVVEKVIKTTL